MSDIETAEARIEALEEQVVELTGLLAELAKSGSSSRKETTWRLSPFNPLVIAAPALRQGAWLRAFWKALWRLDSDVPMYSPRMSVVSWGRVISSRRVSLSGKCRK